MSDHVEVEDLARRLAAILEVPLVKPNDARPYVMGQGWLDVAPPGPLGAHDRVAGGRRGVTVKMRVPVEVLGALISRLEA